jgi:ABC-type multidrug transport system ATPase subunit
VNNLSQNYLIHIQNLTKRYEKLIVVDNLSLDIEQSEVFGLGAKWCAGKTTIIHMLTTLLKPTSGSATVNDFDNY